MKIASDLCDYSDSGTIYVISLNISNLMVMTPKTDIKDNKFRCSLNLKGIFRAMMERGYSPVYETTHIQFDIDDNTAVVEYEEGILSIRLFFSIEEEAYDLFLEASNSMMLDTSLVKSAILDDMKNIMFSFETLCSSMKDFRKFFPLGVDLLKEALYMHRIEMKQLILAGELTAKAIPANDDFSSTADISKSRKILS